MSKYVNADWLIQQCRVIRVTTGDMFIRLINAAPCIDSEAAKAESVTVQDAPEQECDACKIPQV